MDLFKLTCVSCYYPIKNKHGNSYNEWFKNSLAINAPYVFFCESKDVEFIKQFRKDLPTYFIECGIESFYNYRYRDSIKTHPVHCPSVELKMIWNEKVFMVQQASIINPYNTEWFQWIDAGVCVYRDYSPPETKYPNKVKLDNLPKNKLIYSSSQHYDQSKLVPGNYYHHVAGTSYLLHKEIINDFVKLYTKYLEDLVDKDYIFTDQDILSYIYKDHRSLFLKLCDGYGNVVPCLY
jgi:hypothetical protein